MVVVRQIDVVRIAAKGKLQDAHAGKAEVVAQLFDIRRNHPEVLGNDWQFAQRVTNRVEQFPARRLDPATALGGSIVAGNFPTRSKSAKVIDARDVHGLQRGPHACNPPFETIGQHAFPVIKRVTPELSGGAEIIRRHAGYNYRTPILIELELIGVSPDIRRIVGHEYRNIAEQAEVAFVAISLKRRPLFEEQKLKELLRFDLVAQVGAGAGACG